MNGAGRGGRLWMKPYIVWMKYLQAEQSASSSDSSCANKGDLTVDTNDRWLIQISWIAMCQASGIFGAISRNLVDASMG